MGLKTKIFNLIRKLKNSSGNKFGDNLFFDNTVKLGKNLEIGNNVIISRDSVISDNVRIGNNAVLEKIEVGSHSSIESGVLCLGYGNGRIKIGKHSYIGVRNVLDWSDNLDIGNYVHISGSSTGIWTHTSYKQALAGDALDNKGKRITAPVIIEDNVYIGGNCTVYPGITISKNSVILPNSVVNKNTKPGCMYGGVPAVFIKNIES